ncbi:hypothetical protein SPYSS1447_1707 [Streptococcus pyogenes SS1447]|nr:hypothetical protein SPYSS1447_1707 [Streptococcus pyogenes SS1447]KGE57792.1 hypothetical protein MGAS2111_2127 [Streptococcus pyogenes MGAS2111]
MLLLLVLAAGVDGVDEVAALGAFTSLALALEGDAVVEADATVAVCA